MRIIELFIVISLFCSSHALADSSFPRHDGPHTYPGDVPEGCDIIDVTISLEKWLSYEGPFMDFDVPLDITCLISRVYHAIVHAQVNMMCAEGVRTIDWRFQGGGRSGEPIRELGNEIPAHKLRTLSPIEFHGLPATVSGDAFNVFLKTYNEQIRGGKLGTYSWNPDNYRCSGELNCGGYFLTVMKEMLKGYIIEESTDELADELKKDLGPCEHFAWELAGNARQYDEALEPANATGGTAAACNDDDFTSRRDKNCYSGPDGICHEDPTTTMCNGAVQSTNEYAPCYLAPQQLPEIEVTPLICAGAAQSTNPNGICFVESTASVSVTPRSTECSGAAQSSNPSAPCYIAPILTPTATPTEVTCNGVTQSINPTAPCYVPPTGGNPATPTPNSCAGQTQSTNPSGPCYVVPPTVPPGTSVPNFCNGAAQSQRPNSPCYVAPSTPIEAVPTPVMCLGKGQSSNPKAPCYVGSQLF